MNKLKSEARGLLALREDDKEDAVIISTENDGIVHFETERLIFRNLLESDAEDLFVMDSDPKVHEFLDSPLLQSIDEARNVIKMIRKQYVDFGTGRLAVVEKNSNTMIGWAGIKYNEEPINGKNDIFDLGYRFRSSCWGQGYGFEAAFAVTRFAFQRMNVSSIMGSAHIRHDASNKILEKCGLKFVETYWEDDCQWTWYEVSRDDWLLHFDTD